MTNLDRLASALSDRYRLERFVQEVTTTLALPSAPCRWDPPDSVSFRRGPLAERMNFPVPDRSHYPTRKLRLGEAEPDEAATLTPAERFALVWPLSVQAWAFAGKEESEQRLRRDVVRVLRRGR